LTFLKTKAHKKSNQTPQTHQSSFRKFMKSKHGSIATRNLSINRHRLHFKQHMVASTHS
jgi:hypothetical protein